MSQTMFKVRMRLWRALTLTRRRKWASAIAVLTCIGMVTVIAIPKTIIIDRSGRAVVINGGATVGRRSALFGFFFLPFIEGGQLGIRDSIPGTPLAAELLEHDGTVIDFVDVFGNSLEPVVDSLYACSYPPTSIIIVRTKSLAKKVPRTRSN